MGLGFFHYLEIFLSPSNNTLRPGYELTIIYSAQYRWNTSSSLIDSSDSQKLTSSHDHHQDASFTDLSVSWKSPLQLSNLIKLWKGTKYFESWLSKVFLLDFFQETVILEVVFQHQDCIQTFPGHMQQHSFQQKQAMHRPLSFFFFEEGQLHQLFYYQGSLMWLYSVFCIDPSLDSKHTATNTTWPTWI